MLTSPPTRKNTITTEMRLPGDIRLVRLLQLASPALPVGAFSYSQGLEAAVESGKIKDARSAEQWIEAVLALSVARTEAPSLLGSIDSWNAADRERVQHGNDDFLATREAAELRAETVQMGYSLRRLFDSMDGFDAVALAQLDSLDEPAFPTVFAFAVAQWQIDPREALLAYLWSWLENQAMAAIKAVPLGQTDGQRMLFSLGGRLPSLVDETLLMDLDGIGSFAPGLAMASCRHETQYSRLFRS
ncbi:MAG: urease accessory protein UreF [Burkholderiales bacterium]